MAETIKGINVVIGAETTGLSKALSDVNKKSRDIQSELKQVEKLLKLDPTNTELLAQKQKLLSDAVSNTANKLNQLKAAQEQVNQQFAKGEISEGQYRAFQREIAKTEQELNGFENKLDSTGKEINDFGNEAETASGKLAKTADGLKKAGTAITAFGAAAAAGLGAAVNRSMEFEAQISRVGAISDATAGQFDELRKSALDLGASTSKSASEVAKGQEELAALGFTVEEILGAMPGVISAAEASGSDMAQTAEVMASTLNIFGKEASEATKVADILAKTANVSAANLTDMQYALKYAGPPAAALGVSLEELSASIGIMTNAGMKGEQAGTTLRSALLSLLDPSVDAESLMDDLGISVTDASNNFIGMAPLINKLNKSMEGMTETQKAANVAQLVGKEAVSGMLSLMSAGPAKIEKMTAALENSGGASAEAAAKMKDNLKGAIDEMSGSFETLLITIGTAVTPAIQAISKALGELANWFNKLSPSMQNFIAISGAIVAALSLIAGPILLLIGFIPQIVAGFAALAPVTAALGTAFTALTGPIGLVIAAVAALVAGLIYLYNNNETVREGITKAWETIKASAEIVFNAIAVFIKKIFGELQAWWQQWGGTITGIFKDLFEILKIAFQAAFDAIAAIVKTIFNSLKSFWDTWGKTITGLFTTVLNVVKTVFQGVWNNIKIIIETVIGVISGIIKTFLAVLKGDWATAWEAVKGVAESIWNGIKQMFSNVGSMMMSIGKDIMQGLINGIKSMASAVWESAKDVASGIKDGFKDFFGIHSPSRLMTDYGEYISQGLANGISQAGQQAIKSAANVSAAVASAMQYDYGGVSSAASKALNGVQGQGSGSVTNQYNMNGLFNGASIVIRSDDDIRKLGQEFGNVIRGTSRGLGGAAT